LRANLDTKGKLIPPRSLAEAQRRLSQLDKHIGDLAVEIATLQAQGTAPGMLERAGRITRARGNLGWLKAERKQLAAWIAQQTEAEEQQHAEFWKN